MIHLKAQDQTAQQFVVRRSRNDNVCIYLKTGAWNQKLEQYLKHKIKCHRAWITAYGELLIKNAFMQK